MFQESGLFVFFLDEVSERVEGNVLLTAYSVQALAGWGHAADAAVLRSAREKLADDLARVAAEKQDPALRVSTTGPGAPNGSGTNATS